MGGSGVDGAGVKGPGVKGEVARELLASKSEVWDILSGRAQRLEKLPVKERACWRWF